MHTKSGLVDSVSVVPVSTRASMPESGITLSATFKTRMNTVESRDALWDQTELRALGVTGEIDELVVTFAPRGKTPHPFALFGIGELEIGQEPALGSIRDAVGSAVRRLKMFVHITIAIPAESEEMLAAIAEGALMGAYERSAKSANDEIGTIKVSIRTSVPHKRAKLVLQRAQVVARAVATTRWLVNLPPNQLTPDDFSRIVVETARELDLESSVISSEELRNRGYGGLTAVGKGSINAPSLVTVTYRPKDPVSHVALVGKGVTFDSGGISLKPAKSMSEMKSDMAGAATAFQAVVAAALLNIPVTTSAWLPLAENMPSGSACRPGDVIEIYGGTTVEILDTDAEGRLVLADSLAAASETRPGYIVDIATLTGAQIVALGYRTVGVMGDPVVTSKLLVAASIASESLWEMPINGELRQELKSRVADMTNLTSKAGAMMGAAQFLSEFIGNQLDGSRIPWAHLDIAGPAFNSFEPHGSTPTGGTGVMVRTLIEFLDKMAKDA